MDIFVMWVLPIGLMAFMLWQMKSLPKGGRRTYYIVLFLILLTAFLFKNVFRLF